MLIPQYSLRRLLGIMTVCAVMLSVVGLGIRGSAWASALTVAMVALVVLAAVHAFLFAAVWSFAEATSRFVRGPAQSPFLVAPTPPGADGNGDGNADGKGAEPGGASPFGKSDKT